MWNHDSFSSPTSTYLLVYIPTLCGYPRPLTDPFYSHIPHIPFSLSRRFSVLGSPDIHHCFPIFYDLYDIFPSVNLNASIHNTPIPPIDHPMSTA